MNFKKQIFAMARQDVQTIVFPEASFSDKVMQAVKILLKKRLVKVILIGDESAMYLRYSSLESPSLKIINPKTSELKDEFAKQIFALRGKKGVNLQDALELAENAYYFSIMLVKNGYADGIVTGSESSSVQTFKPAMELIKGTKPDALLSSSMLYVGYNFTLRNRPILISDCALVENPTAEGLVDIAKNCVEFWKMLFIQEPKVAFLSYSTQGSAKGESISKMQKASKLFAEKYPEIISDGEMQLDCAIVPKSQAKKFPESKIKGDANILIVPDINSGNMLGKAFHTVGGLEGIGPISQGFARPISDLSRNATINEIVLVSVITAIQAQIE